MEAERDEVAHRADVPPIPLRSQDQRSILDHAQAARFGERVELIEIDERSRPVGRHNRLRPRRDRRFDGAEVEVPRDQVAVDEHGVALIFTTTSTVKSGVRITSSSSTPQSCATRRPRRRGQHSRPPAAEREAPARSGAPTVHSQCG
jgi:hypothetical protein